LFSFGVLLGILKNKGRILTCLLKDGIDVSLIFLCTDSCFSICWNLILQLLLKLEDNRLIETVGIPNEDEKGSVRLTACVSSQVFDLLLNHR
jgi:hypothetical protein